ncbi:hypothetical protein TNCV_3836921 [Trichonephila clavipes]|nr:hypothetical protein TNCV_3836921 [Trichonephila clavipes]
MSPDMMLVDKESSSVEESILNVVAVRPESSTRAVAHHVSMGHQTVCRVLNKNRLHPFSASTIFEFGRLSPPTARLDMCTVTSPPSVTSSGAVHIDVTPYQECPTKGRHTRNGVDGRAKL